MSTFLLEAANTYPDILHPNIFRWAALLLSSGQVWNFVSGIFLGKAQEVFPAIGQIVDIN